MRIKTHIIYIVPIASLMLGTACAATSTTPQKAAVQNIVRCETEQVRLDTSFPTGNIANCNASGSSRLVVNIEPEDAPPINCSAWYAFRLTPVKKGNVTVDLKYKDCGHRYWPKTSEDGVTWTHLPRKSVIIDTVSGVKQAKLSIKLGNKPLFVAGQEIIAPSTYDGWIEKLTKSPNATSWPLGKSAEGRNIPAFTIKQPNSTPKEQIVLIGRQHPPEITGAMAMFSFVETIMSDDPIAVQYRDRFETIVVPMLNPDGVMRGHWRHNVGGTDLNRDWGPFKQPETRLMRDLLEGIAADPAKKLRLFLDFHSTQHDVIYTLPENLKTDPEGYTKAWTSRYQERMPDYKLTLDPDHNSNSYVSKAWVYERFGVPTATYEIGDETSRKLITKLGREAALAMMETLLATDAR